MLFADDLPSSWIAAVAMMATALVTGWVTVRVHTIDQDAKRLRRRFAGERKRCDGLERRVVELETALRVCQGEPLPKRPIPPHDGS